MDSQKAISFLSVFDDTVVNLFFREAAKLGAEKKRLLVTAVGCYSLMDEKLFFRYEKEIFLYLESFYGKIIF